MTTTLRNPDRVAFTIAGQHLEVTGLTGEERLSSLFQFDLVCSIEGAPPPVAGLIGEDAVITLRDGYGNERSIHGLVASAGVRVFDNHKAELKVQVRPYPFPLTVGRDCRSFQLMNVVDIVRKVIEEVRGEKRFELTASYPERHYTVQYREDDWTFASRLLEDEGIFYWFDHTEGSALVFGDRSTAAPEAPGGARIPFAYETGMTADSETIHELASAALAAPTRFTMLSYDFNRPLLKVGGSAGDGPYEHYDAPGGGPQDPAVCQARVTTRLEAANAARDGTRGTCNSVRLFPGVVLQVQDHPIARLDGRYLVVGTRYHVEQRHRDGAGFEQVYSCSFDAIRAAVPYRPPEEMPRPKQLGAQSGITIGPAGEEIYPDPLGRVRVQQHWDRLGLRDEKAGTWMRVSQRGSADSLLFPRLGWTLLTFNEEGEIDAPSVFNRIPDAEHMPPYPLPENKTRLVFKTATSPGGGTFNEIRFEDKKGKEEMFINASRDMNILAQNLKNERVKRDQQRHVGNDHTLTTGADYIAAVDRDQDFHVEGNESLEVTQGYTIAITGNETIKIGGSRKIKVEADSSLGTNQTRTLNVGASMIDNAQGTISSVGGVCTTKTGGAMVKDSALSIAEEVGKTSTQRVTGSKIEKAKANRSTDVKKEFQETVQGSMTLDSGGTYVDNAEKTSSWKVTGALTAQAPSAHLEAKDKIVFRVGESTLTILPDSVEIKSPSFDLSGASKLDYDASTIAHN